MVHSPDFFPNNYTALFLKGLAFLYGSWWADQRWWWVVRAAFCHFGTGVCLHAVVERFFICCSVRSFFLVFFSNLVSVMQMEWLMIPACPHPMCKITRATLKGPIVQKSVDVCVVLYLCMDWFWGFDLGVHTWKEFWNVHLLMTEFVHPEVTPCGWRDVKIQLLTDYPWKGKEKRLLKVLKKNPPALSPKTCVNPARWCRS